MASGTIKTFYIKTGKIGSSTSLNVYQYTSIVTVNGYQTGITISSNNFSLGKLTGVTLPRQQIRVPCSIGDDAYSYPKAMGYFTIAPDGTVYGQSNSNGSNKAIYLSCAYIV